MQGSALVLRDIHQAVAPQWWPPAPGWWVLIGLLLAVTVAIVLHRIRRHRRRAQVEAIFDAAMQDAETPAGQIAVMSELLRRAARQRHPGADTLQGDAWLALLDEGDAQRRFSQGAGRLLLDGGFRREADVDAVAALRRLARERFIGWLSQ